VAPSIFIHGADIVDRGLIVLFFGIFSVAPSPRNYSADALGGIPFSALSKDSTSYLVGLFSTLSLLCWTSSEKSV